ncbi:peptidase MA family metallohydrolase [Novibacillus thermophilus]|jgi:hypothetical protein|uniref:Peptidase MA-like domain-containing protein n=1 Tax=Novibacillus thermophilus TaxID=1471761 RepID=A0A1U9KB33_9BACL|nr:peptidase MA family metallohydrolase [Novibacillus thermophilus]AQS57279.1 hypothetical protein B0W44_17570 [Novibacillus thermophilus]
MKQPRFWLVVFFLFVVGSWASSLFNLETLAQPVFREGNQMMENWRFRYMERTESENFSLLHPGERREEAAAVLDVAERIYTQLTADYALPQDQLITIVLFPDRTSMQERFGWHYGQSATGVYYGGVIYLLSPDDWSNAAAIPPLSDINAWKQYFYRQGPLAHELAHYYLDQMANGNFPRWYTEGFAQWIEYELIGYEWLEPHNVLHEEPLYDYDQLSRSFDQLHNQALAYRQSFMWYRYLLEEYGEEKMDELHALMRRRWPFSTAWKAVYGQTEAKLLNEWKQKVKSEEIR